MKIVGLMLVRNEDWVLKASVNAALRWCDSLLMYFDRCTDDSVNIVRDMADGRHVECMYGGFASHWDEMDVRQRMLEQGRAMGGTHFAIIDGDEILTHNNLRFIRFHFEKLQPGQLLEVPMIPVWDSLGKFRNDGSGWYHNRLTLGFRDNDGKTLAWKAAEDGYQHHARPPKGTTGEIHRPIGLGPLGGVMHLQFANRRRLLAKHVLYRMVDHLRWPGRRTVERLNQIYDDALSTPGHFTSIPEDWWGDYPKDKIVLDGVPWQEDEIRRLLSEHGRDTFKGLDLKGF